MKRAKELYLYLDNSVCGFLCKDYLQTLYWIQHRDIVNTTQTAFLSFKYAERLFVVLDDVVHEITLGKCEGTDKEIREAHNIEKMLLNRAFNWFNPDNYIKESDN